MLMYCALCRGTRFALGIFHLPIILPEVDVGLSITEITTSQVRIRLSLKYSSGTKKVRSAGSHRPIHARGQGLLYRRRSQSRQPPTEEGIQGGEASRVTELAIGTCPKESVSWQQCIRMGT